MARHPLQTELCAYAHSQGGYDNADFRGDNGPSTTQARTSSSLTSFEKTIAVCYVRLRIWRLIASTHSDAGRASARAA